MFQISAVVLKLSVHQIFLKKVSRFSQTYLYRSFYLSMISIYSYCDMCHATHPDQHPMLLIPNLGNLTAIRTYVLRTFSTICHQQRSVREMPSAPKPQNITIFLTKWLSSSLNLAVNVVHAKPLRLGWSPCDKNTSLLKPGFPPHLTNQCSMRLTITFPYFRKEK